MRTGSRWPARDELHRWHERRGWGQRRRCVEHGERGGITILVIGCMVVAALLIMGTIVATSAQIARVRLLDVADNAALDAADALDLGVYDRGLGQSVGISTATVWDSAHAYLADLDPPSRVTDWRLEPGTGTLDGETAVVVLSARMELPVVGALLDSVGGSVTITVRGAARAGLVD